MEQNTQESILDQPTEESNYEDQPNELNSSDEEEQSAEESVDEDQPDDEQVTNMVTLPNGEQVDVEELKRGYMRQQDYTRKTQMLKQMPREVEQEPQMSEEDLEAIKMLKKYGVVTREELEQQRAVQNLEMEYDSWVKSASVTPEQAAIAKLVKQNFPDGSFDRILELMLGGAQKKVVAKKAVGVSAKRSNPDKVRPKITREWIAKLSPAEYTKHKEAIRAAQSRGEIV